jgi:hypothetical protein
VFRIDQISAEAFRPNATVPRKPDSVRPRRRRQSARLCRQFGLLVIFALLPGCTTIQKYSLTYRLWDTDEMRKFSEPESAPHLALFEATNRADVLVQYDAFSEKHSTVERRSYYLQPNQERIRAGKQPEWAQPSAADGLTSIPVWSPQSAATNSPPEVAVYAVTSENGRAFTLARPGECRETFNLPVFVESSGNALRVAETPVAFTGDVVMAGAVVSVVGFLVWAQIGAPY